MYNRIVIQGVPVDNLTMAETLAELEKFIEIGRSTGRSHQVATVNADFITNALGDPELMVLLQKSDLNMPDGMPVVWSARLLGAPILERVAGVDTVMHLCERAAQRGYSIYLLGAAPGVAARAAGILQQRYPDLKIAGVSSPKVPSIRATDPAVLSDIKAVRPDILLVAFGNPKQEKWIGEFRGELQTPVMIGVGGTLDFIAGEKVRAPKWMHRTGLEWTFRLAQEPRRLWRRYCRNFFIFGPQLVRQWWALRYPSLSDIAPGEIEAALYGCTALITLRGSLKISDLPQFQHAVQQILSVTPDILVDCSRADYLDSSAVGALVELARQGRELGGDLTLVGLSEQIYKTLAVLRLGSFFRIFPNLPGSLITNVPTGSQPMNWLKNSLYNSQEVIR